jgi:Mg2+-importing ATPase
MREFASRDQGLTSADAAERLARDGPNVIDTSRDQNLIAKIARRVAEPLVAILLISAAISGATGDWQSFTVIVLIVALSIVLDVFQEHKAESAIAKLQRSIAVTATVRRDGVSIELPVRDIVRGDIVELRGGDLVPADGIVLSSRGALANEANLTGEPNPIEKSPETSLSPAIADASNALFA